MKFFAALTLTLATLISLPSANAAIVTLAQNTHISTEVGGDNTYSLGSGGGTNWGAENFSLNGSYSILRISHVGQHAPNVSPTSIDWRIYSDSLGGPASILAQGIGVTTFSATNVGATAFNTDLTRYAIDISAVILGQGNYWLAFHNSGSSNLSWTFANGGTSFDGKSAVSENNGTNWASTAPNYAFRVEGEALVATPEPASFAIWGGIGLCGLFLSFRRRGRYV